MSDGESGTVQPKSAATVLLLRDSSDGPEVFMVERHQRSHFVAGAYVFPGGRVDPEDRDADSFCVGIDDDAASGQLHLDQGGLAFYVAAIRECFEEAGVLLAYDHSGAMIDTNDARLGPRIDGLRQALNNREVAFLDLVQQEGWRLATDHMHYWSHWITPESSPVRYDTRFFLAGVPSDQAAVHDDTEVTGSAWVTPAEALAKAEREEWTIIFPTLRNLMTIRDFTSVGEAENAGRKRGDVDTLQPLILDRPEGIQAVLPGDEGYEEALAQEKAKAEGS